MKKTELDTPNNRAIVTGKLTPRHMNRLRSCIILRYAALPNSEVMSNDVTNAGSSGSVTTHAGIDIAQNASASSRNNG